MAGKLGYMLGGAAGVAGVAVVALLSSGGPQRGASTPGGDPTVGGRSRAGRAPDADLPASREESASVELELPTETAAALTAPVLERIAAANDIRNVLAEARAGRIDPLDMGQRLEGALRGRPDLGHAVLDELKVEKRPEVGFAMARALATGLDDPELRTATIDALRTAAPETRAVGMVALLGRGEPEALGLATAVYCDDAPEARAAAGFVLNNAPAGLPRADEGRIRDAARTALKTRATPARLREESLGLLGREGAPEADVGLLERGLIEPGEVSVRSRALAAIFTTNAPLARLRPTLERAMADKSLPAELREAARIYLLAH